MRLFCIYSESDNSTYRELKQRFFDVCSKIDISIIPRMNVEFDLIISDTQTFIEILIQKISKINVDTYRYTARLLLYISK